MKRKGRMLWVHLFIIPCLALMALQCGDDDEEETQPAPLFCQVGLLEEGNYEFIVTGIVDYCWLGALGQFFSSAPATTFYLPAGASGYPYTIPGITFPVIEEITGTISANNITGRLQLEIDGQPLNVAINMADYDCSGTLNLVVSVPDATLCPTGANVIASFTMTIDVAPVCNSCSCSGIPVETLIESASPGCSIIITMIGTRQPD